MKKDQVTPLRLFCFLVSLLLVGFNSIAQKLPNVQATGLFAPATIKIDGKANEWDDQFQAYNHNTDISYTVANDDNNLYLVIQANEPDNINKIYIGGLTFAIDITGKKNDKTWYPSPIPFMNLVTGSVLH